MTRSEMQVDLKQRGYFIEVIGTASNRPLYQWAELGVGGTVRNVGTATPDYTKAYEQAIAHITAQKLER